MKLVVLRVISRETYYDPAEFQRNRESHGMVAGIIAEKVGEVVLDKPLPSVKEKGVA